MRPTLPSAALLILFTAGTVAADDAKAQGPDESPPDAAIYGELAFSETIVFDYDRDGTPDSVQFWIELRARPAVGEPGTPGARPESGSVSYFVLDVTSGRRIDDWLLGFNMAGGFPVAGEEYPLTNIRIIGSTALFDLSGSTWTVRDLGDNWQEDDIEIESGGRRREGRFYGGNITVVSEPQVVIEPADIRANRKCNECHEDAAVTIVADGGPHGELKCAACHVKHRREVPDAVPRCVACHDSHGQAIRASSCSTCHSSHTIDAVEYGITVPDEHCVACHERAAARLLESGTLHMGVDCVICHRDEHEAIPSCVDCHGGPHPARVMARPERCVRCHTGAHETDPGD